MSHGNQTKRNGRSSKDLVRLWLAVAITVLHAVYWLVFQLSNQVRLFFESYTTLPVAQWLTHAIFAWLLALLWLANRCWRNSVRREMELERLLKSIAYEVLIVVSPERTITNCSDAVESLFGYRAEEVMGRQTDLLYDDRRVLSAQREIHAGLETVGVHIGCGTGRRKNGDTFPIELTTARLQGAPGVVILIRDITERKLAEESVQKAYDELERCVEERTVELQKANEDLRREAKERLAAEQTLRASEATYRTLTEASPDMIYLLDREGMILYVNPRAAALLGRPAGEIIGKNQAQFFSGESGTHHLQAIQEVFERGTQLVRHVPEHFAQADVWFDTRLVPIVNDDGATITVLGISRDITENRRMEGALRESEEAFRTLVESAMSAIMIVSNTDRILYANRKGAEIVGDLSPQFLVGADIRSILQSSPWKDAGYPVSGRPSVRTETTAVRSDGKPVPVDLAAAPTLWKGEPGTLLIFNDITYRREAEAQMLEDQGKLRHLAAALSVAEEEERRRVAVGLHDGIGQILALCKIRLGSLTADGIPASHAAAVLSDINELIESAIRETRTLTAELSPPVLYELGIDAALEWLAEDVHHRYDAPIEFRTDGRAKPLEDSVRGVLFRGARELLINAIKHAKAKRIRMSNHRVGSHLHLAVEDDGTGFAVPEEESRLRHNAEFGLFYIRERMEFLGGTVVIDSHPGQGTKVTLIVPLRSDSVDGPQTAEAVEAPGDTP